MIVDDQKSDDDEDRDRSADRRGRGHRPRDSGDTVERRGNNVDLDEDGWNKVFEPNNMNFYGQDVGPSNIPDYINEELCRFISVPTYHATNSCNGDSHDKQEKISQ